LGNSRRNWQPPARAGKDRSITHQSGTKQGGPPHDHWAKLGQIRYTRTRYAFVVVALFSMRIHRAAIEKKEAGQYGWVSEASVASNGVPLLGARAPGRGCQQPYSRITGAARRSLSLLDRYRNNSRFGAVTGVLSQTTFGVELKAPSGTATCDGASSSAVWRLCCHSPRVRSNPSACGASVYS
jgi:hypothetical protein